VESTILHLVLIFLPFLPVRHSGCVQTGRLCRYKGKESGRVALGGDEMNMYKEGMNTEETVNGNNTKKKRRRYEWRAQSLAQEESKKQTHKQTNKQTNKQMLIHCAYGTLGE
jgi:hypothetical protein